MLYSCFSPTRGASKYINPDLSPRMMLEVGTRTRSKWISKWPPWMASEQTCGAVRCGRGAITPRDKQTTSPSCPNTVSGLMSLTPGVSMGTRIMLCCPCLRDTFRTQTNNQNAGCSLHAGFGCHTAEKRDKMTSSRARPSRDTGSHKHLGRFQLRQLSSSHMMSVAGLLNISA